MDIVRLAVGEGLDAILLTSLKSIRYHTGFSGSLGVAVIQGGRYNLFVDARYTLQAKREASSSLVEVITIPKGDADEITASIMKGSVKRLGVEDMYISLFLYNTLKGRLPDVEMVTMGDQLDKLRMVKSTGEVEKIKKGAEILDKIYGEVVDRVKTFKSEREISAFIEYRMKMLGSSGPSFDTIVAWKENSAFPHWKTTDQRIGREGFLKMDFGCYIDGYGSDMTRTVYIGSSATERDKEIYNTVLEAQELAISKAREGITTRELDSIARTYIASKGYGDYFEHGLGHGLGIAGGEMPYLSNLTEEIVLKEGMVVTIEPGIYIPGYGGVRIEDDVVITKTGCKILTRSPKGWLEID